MFDALTVPELVAILAATPPVDLKALKLMRSAKVAPGQVFPRGLKRDTYVEAFGEWSAYVNRCVESAHTLIKAIPSIPSSVPVESYPL